MSKIRGDVDAVGVSNLLQMFSMGGCQGILTVYRNLQRKSIQFSPGGMRLVSTGVRQTNPLGEILIRSGRITPEQLEALLADQRQFRKHLGVLAVEKGYLTRPQLAKALEEHIAEEIYELFTWTGATFEYTGTHGEPPILVETPLAEFTLDQDVTSVILEASRLADELDRIQEVIPDVRMIPIRLADIPVDRDERRLTLDILQAALPLIDGQRTVSQIIELSRYPKFRILGTLYELVQRGSLEIRDVRGETAVRRRRMSAVPSGPAGNRTLLVLGPAAESLRVLAAVLRTAGFSVREDLAFSDLGAVLGERRFDAIVLDAEVETENGKALCARVRQTTSVPFVAFSHGATRDSVAGSAESGARFVFLKPVREEVLLQRLWHLVQA